MNFTREPIIETVITPREGCKLVVRNSKGSGQEDYFVDAVEVVSFGHSFFFRSLERPKSFLVPVSDYEVLELKETRVVLKNATAERSIKIGGGRETQVRAQPREVVEESTPSEATAESGASPGASQQERMDRKRDRRRSRRRRGGGSPMEARHEPVSAEAPQNPPIEGTEKNVEESPRSFISKLFPPPPTLIKETLSRYKTTEEGTIIEEKPSPVEEVEPSISEPKPEDETKLEE